MKQNNYNNKKIEKFMELCTSTINFSDSVNNVDSVSYFPVSDIFKKVQEKKRKKIHKQKINKILSNF